MKIIFNKKVKISAFVLLMISAGLLSACGGTSGALSGGAGLVDETTPSPTGLPTGEPVVPAPETSVPVSGHIIFTSNRDGNTSLYMTTPDGSEPIRLTNSSSKDSDPRVSPDGTKVAFVSSVGGNMDIYVLDLNISAIVRITDAEEKDTAPSWSPDGTRIVYESFRDGNFEIYMTNADGSNTIRLTDDPAGDSNPVWSPVANEILFTTNRFGNADLMLLTPSGQVSTLTTSPVPDSAPSWSPDGSMIVFKNHSGELAHLCIIGRDGLNQRCITSFPSEYSSPVWSPDGESIAAIARQNDGYGVDIFNVSDGTISQLNSDVVEPLGAPIWSPEGTRITFQAQVDGDMEIYSVIIRTNEFIRNTFSPSIDGEPAWTTR